MASRTLRFNDGTDVLYVNGDTATLPEVTTPVYPPEARLNMPALFQRGRKPVGKVNVDWGHPLTKGLVRCIIHRQGLGLYDLVTNQVLTGSSSVTDNVTANGAGLKHGADDGGLEIEIPVRSETQNSFTVLWGGYVHGTSGNRVILRDDTSAAGNIPLWNASTTFDLRVGAQDTSATGSWPLEAFKTLCVTSDAANGRLFVDDSNILTTASAPTGSIASPWHLHADGTNAIGGASATDLIFCIWDIPLSSTRALEVIKSPYQFLIPDRG